MVRDRFIDGQADRVDPETETVEDMIRKLLPMPAPPPLQAAPNTFGPGPPHPTTDGNDMPTNAGGTGAIAGE